MLPSSYFVRDATTYRSTTLTRGPWDAGLQHAGPASALLAGIVEAEAAASGKHVARLTLEILRPLPVGGTFRVVTAPGRTGRKVSGVEASLLLDDRPVLRATALLMRLAEVPVDRSAAPAHAIASVDESSPWEFPFFR
jgi:hypothetical protein